MYTVYLISTDHDTGIYIGTTRNLPQRRAEHLSPSHRSNPAKADWIQRHREAGHAIHFTAIAQHPDKLQATQHETRLIQNARANPRLHVYNQADSPSDAPRARTQDGRARTGQINRQRLSRRWTVTDPHGHTQTIRNLKAFCQEHGLDPSTMSRVARGHQPHHKGWTCQPDNER